MSNGAKAFTSLVMFVIGFVIVYKGLGERNIFFCAMMGWLLGGTIWGWFISGKWFERYSGALIITLRCMVAPCVGAVVMAKEFVKLLIGLVKLIITRSRAKKARDSIQAESVENEQNQNV